MLKECWRCPRDRQGFKEVKGLCQKSNENARKMCCEKAWQAGLDKRVCDMP